MFCSGKKTEDDAEIIAFTQYMKYNNRIGTLTVE